MSVRIENQAEPIPGYRLIERLGGGGFGEVWKAEAPGGLLKAIKFVYGDLETPNDEGMRAEQELKALSRVKTVRHPYILSLERFDIIDGQLLIVMELADRNLWDRFRECREQGLPGIPREELLRYMEETAEALDLMNEQFQLQHLDIKPQNLFLVHNHAKVADFGLVKDLQGMMASVTGGVTPVYAAPETFDGWISRFCDQYSLGIVYQELLTGQRPFNGNNIRQLILQHLQKSPDLMPLPAADRDAIGRALAKNPDERFPCCLDLIRSLRGGAATNMDDRHPAIINDSHAEARPTHSTATDETPGHTSARGNGAPVTCAAHDLLESQLAPPSSKKDSNWIRVHEMAEPDAPVHESASTLPPEIQGDGVLVPALVIGLGKLGLGVLQRLRANLRDQVGSPDVLPNIRLLYIDTDPEGMRQATWARVGALHRNEVLLARLNRPSHYLRSSEGRARIDSWFNPKMLYRIPRNLVTTGLRALGRLAFLDNYRLIARRLYNELLECSNPEMLAAAAQRTGLGVRRNHPRVYILTGLAGGSGSGMFLDLAYVIKQQLHNLGCTRMDINGIFFLPEVDRHPGRTLALANTFAALTELNHFSTPGTTFTARYEEKHAVLSDATPPYSRIFTLQLPSGSNDDSSSDLAELSADYIYRELATPLGRVAEETRVTRTTSGRERPGPKCQTFGLYRISWPRNALIHNTARRLCQQLVQRWMSKDAKDMRESIQCLVADLWEKEGLSGEQLLGILQQACAAALGEPPQEIFARLAQPLAQLDLRTGEKVFETGSELLRQLDAIVGRPEVNVGGRGGPLDEPLSSAADAIVERYGAQLANFAVHLVEQPQFRLAGTEEALRQIVARLEQVLQQQEALCKDLTEKTSQAHERILSLLVTIQSGSQADRRKLPTAMTALVELLGAYPQWRYQSLLLKRILNAYVSLRGHLSDQLREINYCRDRLGELRRSFENPEKAAPAREDASCGRSVFPFGCRNLNESVKQLGESLTADDLRDLDTKVQTVIHQQFNSLVHVCMTSSNLLQNLELAMQQEAEEFIASRLAGISAPELYLKNQADPDRVQADLSGIYNAAAPQLSGQRFEPQAELRFMAIPSGPGSDRLQDLAEGTLQDMNFVTAPGVTDIVVYRESPELPLAEFTQLGPLAYQAYRQVSGIDSFTPHSRVDISQWRAAVSS